MLKRQITLIHTSCCFCEKAKLELSNTITQSLHLIITSTVIDLMTPQMRHKVKSRTLSILGAV